jgi:hypothetical protein
LSEPLVKMALAAEDERAWRLFAKRYRAEMNRLTRGARAEPARCPVALIRFRSAATAKTSAGEASIAAARCCRRATPA